MKSETKSFIYFGILAVFTLAVPIMFSARIPLMMFFMAIVSMCMILLKPTKTCLIVFIASFILGSISEIISIHFGLWSYRDEFFKGIPIYLPFVWGNAGLYISNLHDFIKQYEN